MVDGILTPCNVARSWHWFHQVTAPCNVACGYGIITLNSPSGSTLQYGRWLWDDMPLNSLKRPPYWNSTSAFDFDHITAANMSFCSSIRNLIQIRPPSLTHSLLHSDDPRQKKMTSELNWTERRTSCRFSRWRISAILDFRGPIMGSLKSPGTTSYKSLIETIALNCLVFEKIAFFFAFWQQTDKQTDK